MILAQRFSAGYPRHNLPRAREAGDRISSTLWIQTSAVRFTDLETLSVAIPALKRWAICASSAVADVFSTKSIVPIPAYTHLGPTALPEQSQVMN